MSKLHPVNANDFESPGYEYLRSYQNMSNLYHKLVALNYQKEFCSTYRCPPIHRYYFSIPSGNHGEQQFLFICLCAWLIKDKCQMNLELEPEEYEDMDTTVGVILEALRLLLTSDDESKWERNPSKNNLTFPPGRLKQGFGPEVVWTMNILADRALELIHESQSSSIGGANEKVKVIYNNKVVSTSSSEGSGRQIGASSITIGQPFVGGGLTTRPLGSYQIDDSSLLFDDDERDDQMATDVTNINQTNSGHDDWYNQVERAIPALESAKSILCDNIYGTDENWSVYLNSSIDTRRTIEEFLNQSKSLLNVISNRIDRHLQVIKKREKFIQTNLKIQISDFLKIWREYSLELTRNQNFIKQVNLKTDQFENFNEKLQEIGIQIGKRVKELSDGSRLREFELMVDKLREETDEFDIKIGLLLTVYAEMQRKIVSANIESH